MSDEWEDAIKAEGMIHPDQDPLPGPEDQLRSFWNEKGIPVEEQDRILAEIDAKAQPGALVGPFVIGQNPDMAILSALDGARDFIEGFEGDEAQEGVDELLAGIERARKFASVPDGNVWSAGYVTTLKDAMRMLENSIHLLETICVGVNPPPAILVNHIDECWMLVKKFKDVQLISLTTQAGENETDKP